MWLPWLPWLPESLERSQPVTTSTVARIANVITAGRVHFDCATAMVTRSNAFVGFITLSF